MLGCLLTLIRRMCRGELVRTSGLSPCPGGVRPRSHHDDHRSAPRTRLPAMQRTIDVGCVDGVLRVGNHCCTIAGNPKLCFVSISALVFQGTFGGQRRLWRSAVVTVLIATGERWLATKVASTRQRWAALANDRFDTDPRA